MFIQTKFNGHCGTGMVKTACRAHGVRFHIGAGIKMILQQQLYQQRYDASV